MPSGFSQCELPSVPQDGCASTAILQGGAGRRSTGLGVSVPATGRETKVQCKSLNEGLGDRETGSNPSSKLTVNVALSLFLWVQYGGNNPYLIHCCEK